MSANQIIAERYELLDLIDEGGMGQVFRARDTQTGETVAVKALKEAVVAQDPTLVERFCREALVLRKLNHPNIVRVYDTFEEAGRDYIVMEYIPGGSLAHLIRREGPLPIARAVAIALDLADALTRTHRIEVIHRDLKPANVLLSQDGTPRLTDFGVAHMADAGTIMTQVGSLLGTIAYLSPEVSEGAPHNEKSDIWSFGLILYEMLAGRHPYNETTPSNMMTAILRRPIPDLRIVRAEVPEDLVRLVERMTEKDPEQRIGSAREIGAELERILVALRREMPDLRGDAASASRFTPTPVTPLPAVSATPIPVTRLPSDTAPIPPRTPPVAAPLTPASPTPGSAPSVSAAPQPVTTPRRVVTDPRLFIAYRREDSGEIAGRLYEQLAEMVGDSGVVRDVDRYADRTVSRYVLANDVVGSVDVMLVLVGPSWVGMPRDRGAAIGARAIDNPKDSVRMQIEAGLRRPEMLMIPVLVNGGALPANLPISLAGLSEKTPFIVAADQPLEPQVKKLVRVIHDHFGIARRRSPLIWVAVAIFVALLALAGAVIVAAITGAPLPS